MRLHVNALRSKENASNFGRRTRASVPFRRMSRRTNVKAKRSEFLAGDNGDRQSTDRFRIARARQVGAGAAIASRGQRCIPARAQNRPANCRERGGGGGGTGLPRWRRCPRAESGKRKVCGARRHVSCERERASDPRRGEDERIANRQSIERGLVSRSRKFSFDR